MSQSGTNENKTNKATGATASNTIINSATNNTRSALKQDTIAWKYKGFFKQTVYKKNFPESI